MCFVRAYFVHISTLDLSRGVIRANSPIAGSSLIPRLQSSFEDTVTRDVQELCSSFDRGLSGELEEDGEEDDPMEGGTGDAEDVVMKINGAHAATKLDYADILPASSPNAGGDASRAWVCVIICLLYTH